MDNREPEENVADKFAKDFGFQDAYELARMVNDVKIDTPKKLQEFKDWQFKDGTRAGLQKLLEKQAADDTPAEDAQTPPV